MKKHEIPKEILERVESELLPDEDLLWVGQPYPTRFLWITSYKTHPLLSSTIAAGIGLVIAALFSGSLLLLALSITALVLAAIIGGIAQQIYRANKTIYAISNQRALIIYDNQVETFGAKDLQSIVKKTKSKGQGDIIFRKDSQSKITPSAYGLMLHRQEETERGFLGIENPNHVELLLLNTFGDNARIERLVEQDVEADDAYFEDEYQAMRQET